MQGSAIAYLARENLAPSVGAAFFGPGGVGLYGWGFNMAGVSLIPSFIFGQLSYQTFARLQDAPELVSRILNFTFRSTLLLGGLAMIVLLGFGEQVVHYIYGDKWRPALSVLYAWTLAAPFVLFVSPRMQALLGTGQHKLALKVNAVWTTAAICLAVWFSWRASYPGLAVACSACVAAVAVYLLATAEREVRLGVLSTSLRFTVPIGGALTLALALRPLLNNPFTSVAAAAATLAVYAVLATLMFWTTLRSDLSWLRSSGALDRTV
jgi:PST family polysaccharide transporter